VDANTCLAPLGITLAWGPASHASQPDPLGMSLLLHTKAPLSEEGILKKERDWMEKERRGMINSL